VIRAVLFDVGNTLLHLDYDRLARGVGDALGLTWPSGVVAAGGPAAFTAIADAWGSDRARAERFLATLFGAAGVPPTRFPEVLRAAMALHQERHLWTVVDPAAPAVLARLRDARLRLGVVSNSDGRVAEALDGAGLGEYFEIVVDSAAVGVEKPDPRIFRPALDHLALPAASAVYVGDRYEVDVVGARRAGLEAVLLTPAGGPSPPGPCRTVPTLEALAELLLDRSATLT